MSSFHVNLQCVFSSRSVIAVLKCTNVGLSWLGAGLVYIQMLFQTVFPLCLKIALGERACPWPEVTVNSKFMDLYLSTRRGREGTQVTVQYLHESQGTVPCTRGNDYYDFRTVKYCRCIYFLNHMEWKFFSKKIPSFVLERTEGIQIKSDDFL